MHVAGVLVTCMHCVDARVHAEGILAVKKMHELAHYSFSYKQRKMFKKVLSERRDLHFHMIKLAYTQAVRCVVLNVFIVFKHRRRIGDTL